MKKQIYLYDKFKSEKDLFKGINKNNIEKIFDTYNFDF